MKIVTQAERLKTVTCPIVMAAGFFDGVHLGHRKVVDQTVAAAAARGGQAWVLTFDTHPMRVLQPDTAPALLTSIQHKLSFLAALGPHGCLVIPFSRALADRPPADFVGELRATIPSFAEIVVGRNWRFGQGGRGNAALLSRLGRQLGFAARVVRPVIRGGHPVSSTRIRTAVAEGNLDEAGRLLGRSFSVLGSVVPGHGRGRILGFPTANLDPHNELLPPHGVYAVLARLWHEGKGARHARIFEGVLNLGVRPTFESADTNDSTAELHLFDYDGQLYGRDLEILFVKRLRGERRFNSEQALCRRIKKDIQCAREILSEKNEKNPFTAIVMPYYSHAHKQKKG